MTNPTFNAIAANIVLIESRLARTSVPANAAHQTVAQASRTALSDPVPLHADLAYHPMSTRADRLVTQGKRTDS